MFVLMSISCILCYTFQTFFNKLYSGAYRGPESAATPVFSVLYGVIVGAATLAANGGRFEASTVTWGLGLLNGFVLFAFNLSSINAARKGPYSLQSIMMLFGNVLLPLLFSAVVWQERLGTMALVGIVIMLAAFIVINSKGLSVHGKPGYFGWVVALFFANGIYGIVMDAQQRLCMQTQRNEMIIITFFFSAVISIIYLLIGQKGAWLDAFRMGKKAFVFTLVSALSAAAAVYQMMVLLGTSSAAILYTINNGSIMVLSALLSAVVLKEKLSGNTVAGIVLAAISLVLVNL